MRYRRALNERPRVGSTLGPPTNAPRSCCWRSRRRHRPYRGRLIFELSSWLVPSQVTQVFGGRSLAPPVLSPSPPIRLHTYVQYLLAYRARSPRPVARPSRPAALPPPPRSNDL